MKSKLLLALKNPRRLACCISFALMPVSYLGLRLCAYLDSRFPMHYEHGNWSYFGHFDGLAALFYLLFFIGMACSAICCLGLLIAGIIFLFHRRHPKKI
jgi:hypothetical protein